MLSVANLANAATAPRPRLMLPGATASGIASGAQLVEATPYFAPRTDMTAVPGRLIVLASAPRGPEVRTAGLAPLLADDYPVLAAIWDNDADDIFDTI